jgi:hypothetical protein
LEASKAKMVAEGISCSGIFGLLQKWKLRKDKASKSKKPPFFSRHRHINMDIYIYNS